MTPHRALVRAAYHEFQIATAYSTGTMPDVENRPTRGKFAPEVERYLSGTYPPRWFVDEELGFRLDQGPSLVWTQRVLALTNARAMRTLGVDAPTRFTYPRRKSCSTLS